MNNLGGYNRIYPVEEYKQPLSKDEEEPPLTKLKDSLFPAHIHSKAISYYSRFNESI